MRMCFVATALAILLGSGSGIAQVGSSSPGTMPLGMTSPLGIGPGGAVGPTEIPMGAMELASPGLSPPISGVLSTGGNAPCATGSTSINSGTGMSPSVGTSPSAGMSSGAAMSGTTSVFDGGGTSGMASPGCATTGSSLAGPAAASASSPTTMGSLLPGGRTGIPLGSSELGAGGLSPPPLVPTVNPSAPTTGLTASPLAATPVLTPSAPVALPCVTTTAGGGVGMPSTPGAPLIGQTATSPGSC
jgi:hypothetical protein